jgi:hypothetical protein
MEAESTPIKGHGLLTMPDVVWELARRRAEVIAPLAGAANHPQALSDAAKALPGGVLSRSRSGVPDPGASCTGTEYCHP